MTCHISCNLDGDWFLVPEKYSEKFNLINIFLPFGYMLILTNDVTHGGYLGPFGSFFSFI